MGLPLETCRPNATFVGIHGAHDAITKSVDPIRQPQIFAFYKHNMGERFNAEVMNKALYDMEDAGALLRVFDAARSPKRVPYHCKSNQTLRSAWTPDRSNPQRLILVRPLWKQRPSERFNVPERGPVDRPQVA